LLRTLPGFGEYTAGAVAALAFGAPSPAADANVTRVVSRLFALPGVAGGRRNRVAVRHRLETLLPAERPGDFLAACMDLGQRICASRRPRCEACPVGSVCAGRARGAPESFPARRERPRPESVRLAAVVVERGGRVLLRRRAGGYLEGLWEFPSCPRRKGREPTREALRAELHDRAVELARKPAATVRHSIVQRRLSIDVFRGTAAADTDAADPFRWFSRAELSRAAIPTLTRKIAVSSGFLRDGFRRILFAK
jgi:A/G-specific adenine glycosylase